MTILSLPRGTMSEADRCGNSDRPLTHHSDCGGRGLAVKATQTCSVGQCDRPAYARGWCRSHYARWQRNGVVAETPLRVRTEVCRLDGCDKPTPYGKTVCRMHLTRKLRTGTFDAPVAPVPAEFVVNPRGYLKQHAPGHPLANLTGQRGYAHRIALYDAIGPGTHLCTYCNQPVTWDVDLHVDHIDNDKTNNDPANLAPCCGACNARKGGKT